MADRVDRLHSDTKSIFRATGEKIMAQPTASTDINLLDVKDSVIWGLSGEAGLSYELNPKTDLRMCYSGQHESFVAGFSRMIGILPTRFGLTFEVEIDAGSGSVGIDAMEGTHPLLKKVIDENRYLRSSRSIRYYAHLWSEP